MTSLVRSLALGLIFGREFEELAADVPVRSLAAFDAIASSGIPLEQAAFVITKETAYRTSRAELVNSFHANGLPRLAKMVALRRVRRGHLLCMAVGDGEPRIISLPFAAVRAALARPAKGAS